MALDRMKDEDFLAGATFVVLGALFAGLSLRYRLGTAAQMGPGYFPLALGILLFALGAFIVSTSLKRDREVVSIAAVNVSGIILIVGPLLFFAFFLDKLGLLLCGFVAVVISTMASKEFHWRGAALYALIITAAIYVLFIVALRLPMPVLPRWL